ncbi:Coenzyme F420 hydrogenase/dehydrogenase, beta subunit C-terminal domain [Clostridium tyrobutyricum]|uniref:Coenzyme F420 hydrogenase/dehydrogenase, beta subunit C-terminal domain n=1 Tax=Clostridium tyrobutyricum TaxID=1519 RepID=UPI001C381E49|nr:Coenzyme F420 hydrogenase/dehydrogenase, beta subunit C-terminal domain [Clostridium tyrobutyricum]MBV4420083.1 Coenzyme F420 hydrogenase/dehydrogenase, beta subunit C-terminal domain [Clostridium tyrobutyricum]
MIEITNKENCSGCSSCANICPKKCITMQMDEEGFLYPKVNKLDCINCNLCEHSCPILNPIPEEKHNQKAFLIQNKDEKIRKESTSGGAFTAIASYILSRGGVVFGACFDESYVVRHIYVEQKKNLEKFRNSKYVQSEIGDTFIKAKYFLDSGRMVCFSGTPCQIEGLKSYLGKEYRNLITVDLICRAVPSPLLWKKYLDMKKDSIGNNINKVMFRDKYYGYKYSTMTICSDKKQYHAGVESDQWLRAFFTEICDRPSCYQCKFKKRYRISDFTIWDCFTVDAFNKEMDDDKGTTRMITQSAKGEKILDLIKHEIVCYPIDLDKSINGVKEMFYSVEKNHKREQFVLDMQNMDGKNLLNKYFPETFKVKLERSVRLISYQLGIYKQMKKIAKKFLKK